MRALTWLPLLTISLSACATLPSTQNTPFLPPGVFGAYEDNDTGAISQSAWAFASPSNTRGNPVAAARAVVALEYLSGELRENPRWINMDYSVKVHMSQARDQLQKILGIRPDVPPQVVVNTLLALSMNLQFGNTPAAMQGLASPIFTHPPEQTLQILANLPYVQEANVATAGAADQEFPPGGARS